MATFETIEAAARRARKRYAHAVAQQADACSERAAKRHARAAQNALRALKEAQRGFGFFALAEVD